MKFIRSSGRIYPLKNPVKTLRSEFVVGLLLTSFRFGMKKNFLMSKSNSDDAFVGSSVGVGVDESTATFTGVDAVVVVKKNASASDCVTVPDGGLGALSYNESKQMLSEIMNLSNNIDN